MSAVPEGPRERRRDTIRRWHQQESFWREVYARTFAAVITALLAGSAGLLLGVIKVNGLTIWRVLLTAVPLVIFFGLILLAQLPGFRVSRRRYGPRAGR